MNIPAVDWNPASIPAVSITSDSLLVQEGLIYPFKTAKGNVKAFYRNGSYYFEKTDNDIGELKILRFDQLNRVLSGTFFFTGTDNSTGQTVNITEGRFDIRY